MCRGLGGTRGGGGTEKHDCERFAVRRIIVPASDFNERTGQSRLDMKRINLESPFNELWLNRVSATGPACGRYQRLFTVYGETRKKRRTIATDRLKHIQRPIMINDATDRSKSGDFLSLFLSPSLSFSFSPCLLRGSRKKTARLVLFPRFFWYVNDLRVSLLVSFRPRGEKERRKTRIQERHRWVAVFAVNGNGDHLTAIKFQFVPRHPIMGLNAA